ncbi:MAG: hypothetical protein ACI8QZ_002852 [Chlamydiales bacterium]|jgi:hypothetical protein
MEPDIGPAPFGVGHLRRVGQGLLRIPFPVSAVPCLVWAGLIWWLSSQAVIEPPPLVPHVPLLSNLVHAIEFGFLALWSVLLLPRRDDWPVLRRGNLVRCLVATLIYAVVDEWHQSFVPNRDASLLDVLTDGVGIVSVLWVIAYLGDRRADTRGLGRRLGFGIAACVGAAWLATFYGDTYGTGPWPS